jgi:hypothetical protein
VEAQRRVERIRAMGRAHILGGLGQVSRNGNGTHTHTVDTHTPHTYMCSHTHTLTHTHSHSHTHTHTHTLTLTLTHTNTHTRTHARTHASTHTRAQTHAHAHARAHSRTHERAHERTGRRAQVHPRGQVRGGRDVLGLHAVPDLPRGAPPVRRPRLGPTRIAPAPDSANNRQRCVRRTALTPCAMQLQRTTCDAQHATPLQDRFTAACAATNAAACMCRVSSFLLLLYCFRDHPYRWTASIQFRCTGGGAVRRSLALKRSAAPTAHVQVLCRADRPRRHAATRR